MTATILPACLKAEQTPSTHGSFEPSGHLLVLHKPEDRSAEDQDLLSLLQQAHPQVSAACKLTQAFVQMIRERDASALEPWFKEATESGVSELRTFATGIKRDQPAVLAALTYE